MLGPDNLIEWIRKLLAERGLAVGALAASTGIERKRLRRVLGGSAEMTVREMVAIVGAMEISAEEMGMSALEAASASPAPVPEAQPAVDPWGNQTQQLFEMAFALGCDFSFLADTSALTDSGIPEPVLARFNNGPLLIKLDAAYHKYNKPRYTERDVTLTLSFDALYDCTFPWTAISQVAFFPMVEELDSSPEPDDGEEETPDRPTLRLVT
jgi:hypothetical protein